jgi:nucleoside 2-deoxyribosyltransferase
MNRLNNARCYLAGAIEKSADAGMSWRKKVKTDLVDIGIQWLDPCDKPAAWGRETPEMQTALKKYRFEGNFQGIRDIMLPICRMDLRLVDISDFIIVNLDPDVPTFGTHEEVSRAVSQNKPVLVRIQGGKEAAPLWWYERLDHNMFFGTWDELYLYLSAINHSKNLADTIKRSNYKWIFFDWMGK